MPKRHQILVVERFRTLYRLVREALPRIEYDVKEVPNPTVARKRLAILSPCLAFVSTDFKNRQAFLLAKEMADLGIAVIIVEKWPTHQTVVRAARCGALDVLIAPLHPLDHCGPHPQGLGQGRRGILPSPEEQPKIRFPSEAKDPRSRVEFALKKARELLALPHAVSAVLRLCSQPDTAAADLLATVESDSAITARAFRLANSVAQGSRHPITDLQAAIARLGIRATASMAMAQSVFDMFDRVGDTFGFDRTEYWVHSLGTACCARALAAYLWEHGDPADAFLAGLLHDIGKMLLDEYLPMEYQEAVRNANIRRIPLVISERQKLGADHTYAGVRLADLWGLPEHVRRAIALHHNYSYLVKAKAEDETEGPDAIAIAQCTALANQLAKAFGFGSAGDSLVESEALQLWSTLADAHLDLGDLYASLRADLEEFLELLEVSPDELRLEFPELGTNLSGRPRTDARVLLCIPEDQPSYDVLLEAFFLRCGYTVVTLPRLEAAPPIRPSADEPSDERSDGPPFAVGVTSVSGAIDDLEKAADMLLHHASAGIILTDCPLITNDTLEVREKVTAIRPRLDFLLIEELLEEARAPTASPS